jgi:glycosyltransferase involved in cell wall biosynthesis
MRRNLSVLLPTLNSMALLPAHIESMHAWIDLADEIIVVDSHSDDGTLDCIRERLGQFHPKIHSHPRGLYQCWNHGIGQAKNKWLYISTVGDAITRDLLVHLLDTAECFDADVVLGSPRFIDESNQALPGFHWAVTDLAENIACTGPTRISGPAALFYAAKHLYTSALLGSSASNLYRTSHLTRFPFPTNFAWAGDAAWGIQHALDSHIACTNRAGSDFRIHRKNYDDSVEIREVIEKQLVDLTMEVAARDEASISQLKTGELTFHLQASIAAAKSLKSRRQKCVGPWYLNPGVWRERARLKRHRNIVRSIVANSTELIRSAHCHRS